MRLGLRRAHPAALRETGRMVGIVSSAEPNVTGPHCRRGAQVGRQRLGDRRRTTTPAPVRSMSWTRSMSADDAIVSAWTPASSIPPSPLATSRLTGVTRSTLVAPAASWPSSAGHGIATVLDWMSRQHDRSVGVIRCTQHDRSTWSLRGRDITAGKVSIDPPAGWHVPGQRVLNGHNVVLYTGVTAMPAAGRRR